MRAKWFDTLINADIYLKRSPATNGWQHSFRLRSQLLVNGCHMPKNAALLSLCTVTWFILPYHVLYRLHAQDLLVRLHLYLREWAEYDLIVFLGKLVLDNSLGPNTHRCPNLVHRSLRWNNNNTPRLTFARNTTAAVYLAEFPRPHSP